MCHTPRFVLTNALSRSKGSLTTWSDSKTKQPGSTQSTTSTFTLQEQWQRRSSMKIWMSLRNLLALKVLLSWISKKKLEKFSLSKKGNHLTYPFPHLPRAATPTSWHSGKKSLLLMIHHRKWKFVVFLRRTVQQTQYQITLDRSRFMEHRVKPPLWSRWLRKKRITWSCLVVKIPSRSFLRQKRNQNLTCNKLSASLCPQKCSS